MKALRWLPAAIGLLAAVPPAAGEVFTTYRCQDGSEFVAAFYEGDKRAYLQLDGRALALSKRISVNGSRYAKGDTSVRFTKAGITLKRGRTTTSCAAF